MQEDMRQVLDALPAALPGLDDFYKDLHQHPELSMAEVRTRGIVAERLRSLGYDVHEVGGGVVGVLANGKGCTVLLRADFDALPVKEDSGLSYASRATATAADGTTVPVMHACGHDVHATALMGAAELLVAGREHWQGTVEVLFQPGEETAAGARAMVADHLVDRIPKPEVALGQHVLGITPSGTVATTAGPVLSTAASLRVVVHGKGSHGSMPHLGIDPVLTAAAIITRLQGIVAREVAPADFAVVSVGSVQAGSTANVIPDRATLLLNVRAYSEQVREQLVAAIRRIVEAECAAGNCPEPPEVEVYDQYPLTSNDTDLTRLVTAGLREALGQDEVGQMAPQTASEDFSVVPDAFGIPYTYWGLGGFTEGQEVVPNHNPRFAPAMHPTLETGVTAMVAAALACLRD